MISYYLLALTAWLYLLSAVYGEGIYEEGIFYFNGMTLIILADKWEQIKKADIKKEQLTTLSFTSNRGTRVQYYRPEDYDEIKRTLSYQDVNMK